MTTREKGKGRGFSSMNAEQRKRIASMGGKAAQSPQGNGHRFTREELQRGGKRGGSVSRRKSKKPTSGV